MSEVHYFLDGPTPLQIWEISASWATGDSLKQVNGVAPGAKNVKVSQSQQLGRG